MQVQYAGQSLYSAGEIIDKLRDLEFSKQRIFSNTPRPISAFVDRYLVSSPEYFWKEKVSINTLEWPVGASRFGSYIAVVTQDELHHIHIKTSALGGLEIQPADLAIIDNDGNTFNVEMYPLVAIPVSQFVEGSFGEEIYLLPLVDKRYYWWYKSASVSVTAGTTTWSSLFSSIFTELGESNYTVSSINSNYHRPGSDFSSNYEVLSVLLDAAANAVGKRVVVELDGEVKVVSPEQAIETFEDVRDFLDCYTAGDLYKTLESLRQFNAAIPDTVDVVFPKEVDGEFNGQYVKTVTLPDITFPEMPAGAKGFPGKDILYSSSKAKFTGATHDNESENNSTAIQMVQDYIKWRSYGGTVSLIGTIQFDIPAHSDGLLLTPTHTIVKLKPIDEVNHFYNIYGVEGEGSTSPNEPGVGLAQQAGIRYHYGGVGASVGTAGDFVVDNATPSSVTELYLHYAPQDYEGIEDVLELLKTNDIVIYQRVGTGNEWFVGKISSTPTDNSTYYTIPVTHLYSSSGHPTEDLDVAFFFFPASGSIPELTTKGDIIVHNGTSQVSLGIGTNNQVLVVDTATSEGIKWGAVPLPDTVPVWTKFTIDHTDLQAASGTATFTFATLPAGVVVNAIKIKTSTAFAGTGVTLYELTEIGDGSDTSRYYSGTTDLGAVLDMTTAVSTTFGHVLQGKNYSTIDDHTSTTSMVMTVNCNVNTDNSTAGSVDVWVLYAVAD